MGVYIDGGAIGGHGQVGWVPAWLCKWVDNSWDRVGLDVVLPIVTIGYHGSYIIRLPRHMTCCLRKYGEVELFGK
jgi:hypothetical protein